MARCEMVEKHLVPYRRSLSQVPNVFVRRRATEENVALTVKLLWCDTSHTRKNRIGGVDVLLTDALKI